MFAFSSSAGVDIGEVVAAAFLVESGSEVDSSWEEVRRLAPADFSGSPAMVAAVQDRSPAVVNVFYNGESSAVRCGASIKLLRGMVPWGESICVVVDIPQSGNADKSTRNEYQGEKMKGRVKLSIQRQRIQLNVYERESYPWHVGLGDRMVLFDCGTMTERPWRVGRFAVRSLDCLAGTLFLASQLSGPREGSFRVRLVLVVSMRLCSAADAPVTIPVYCYCIVNFPVRVPKWGSCLCLACFGRI